MGYLGILLFSLGVLVTTSSSRCIPETEECSRYWVKMEPHKNLMESENELNSWCRKQILFYKCLEDGLLRSGNSSDLPINFLISKMFSADLCTDDSRGRKRYLNNAACINQLDTEYCTLPEYLDIVTPDDAIPSKCSLSEQTFSCIAATIVSNCGFDAGRVYRYLLKVISYSTEVCDIEGFESLPPCEDEKQTAPKREEELAEIFYGLINRFGDIPEQIAEKDVPVFSNEVEYPVTDMDESLISEVIRDALDNIHEESSPEMYETILLSDQSDNLQQDAVDTIHYDVKIKDSSYKRTPIITEPFKGLLHYNYSGKEYAIYWRQPDGFEIENVECEHLLPSFLKGVIFQCVLYRRLRDPDCIYSVEDEPITPELIRDIDPDVPQDSMVDFGPRPYWMEELDEYKRQRDLRRMSNDKFSTSNVKSVTESTRPAACESDTLIHEMIHDPDFKWWKCLNVFSEELREDIVSVLLPDITEDDIPLMSAHYSSNAAHVFLYEARLHDLENVFCGRVNECHPKGRGIFKCSLRPREMKLCHNCFEESTSPSPAFDNLRNLKTAPSNVGISSEVTDFSSVESSGDSLYETSSDNLITLLLSRDVPPVSDKPGNEYTEDIMAEEDELVAIDISKDIPEQSQNDDPSGLSFVIIDHDVKLPDDGSETSSDNLQKDRLDDHESDSSYKLSSEDEYKLMRENVILLQAIKPNVDIHAIYEMETPEKNQPSQDFEKMQ